jgi:hypothetical protein
MIKTKLRVLNMRAPAFPMDKAGAQEERERECPLVEVR